MNLAWRAKTIETLAREMCRKAGQDPDEKVYPPNHMFRTISTPAGPVVAPDRLAPLWEWWSDSARFAIDAYPTLKSLMMEPTGNHE